MATEPNNIFINTFIKGMNSDVAIDVVNNQQYTFAQNYRIQTQTGINSSQTVNDGDGVLTPISTGRVFQSSFMNNCYGVLATGSIGNVGVVIIKDSYNSTTEEYTWSVYRITRVDDTIRYKRVFGVYDNDKHAEGAVTKLSKFSIALDQPQEDVLNLYIADGVHQLMVINVLDDSFADIKDVQYIEYYASYPRHQAIVVSLISGSLKTSQVIYQYRFYKKYGIISALSPETKPLQIIAQSRQTEKGCAEDTATQAGVRLRLPDPDTINTLFDHVQVFRVQQIKPDEVKIFLIADRKVHGGQPLIIDDIGSPSELQEYSLDEYNALTSLHIIPKCIETAQSRLFCGNILDTTVLHDNDIKTHTYSAFNNSGEIKLWNDNGDYQKVLTFDNVRNLVYSGYYKNGNRGVNEDYVGFDLHPTNTDIIGGKSEDGTVEWKLVYTRVLLDEQESLLDCTQAVAHTSDIDTSIKYSNGTGVQSQSKYYSSICDVNTITDATYNYSYASSYLRSLRRNETYRYGVIFYTNKGERTPVMWIDDIKVPNESVIPSTVFENNKLYAQPIGIEFKISLENTKYVQYQIVRCAKIPEYTRDLYQVVICPTVHNSMPSVTKRFSPWYPMPFLLTHPFCLSEWYFITNSGSADKNKAWQETRPLDLLGAGKYVHVLMSEDINIKRQTTLTAISSDDFTIRFIKNKVFGSIADFNDNVNTRSTKNDVMLIRIMFDQVVQSKNAEFENALLHGYIKDPLDAVGITYVTKQGASIDMKNDGNGRIPIDRVWITGTLFKGYEWCPQCVDYPEFIDFFNYLQGIKNGLDTGEYGMSDDSRSRFDLLYSTMYSVYSATFSSGRLLQIPSQNDERYYALQWVRTVWNFNHAHPTDIVAAFKGINNFTSKNSDTLSYAYYNDGNSSFSPFIATAFGDTKQPQWSDGFDNKKSDNTFITSYSKKYQQFDTTLNNIRYVNWFAGMKYDLNGRSWQTGVNKADDEDDGAFGDQRGEWSFPPGNYHRGDHWDACVELVTISKRRPLTAYGWIGPGPISIIMTSENNKTSWLNTTPPSMLGCYIAAISHSATQFAGDTTTLRQYDTYYGHGNYCDINDKIIVFDGDVYIAPAEIISMYKAYDFESSLDSLESMQVVNYVPMESVINPYFEYGLNYRNTQSKNIMTEPGEISGVTSQDRPAYCYNDVYSQNDVTSFVYEPELLESDQVRFQSRVVYSEEQTAADSINNKGVFKALNYIDTESKYGPISHVMASKDVLYVWQTNAFAKLSINERSLVKDENSNTIQLGQGGVLQRVDYIDQVHGMREYDKAAVGVNDAIYWLDMENNSVMAYSQNVDSISTKMNVQNYLNENINHKDQVWLSYDNQYKELLCKCINDGKQLVFNIDGQYASGVYTRDYLATVSLTSTLYGINNEGLVQYTNLQKTNDNKYLSPTILKFVVNGVATTTKVFDNQQINVLQKNTYLGLDQSFMSNKQFGFETDLYNKFSMATMNSSRISAREGNIQYAIPRANDLPYGNRMRGKWMHVTMIDNEPEYDYAISHIITKFRQSFS